MTHKRTNSDDIKDFLIRHPEGGGRAKDWKRRSKNEQPDGSILRVFENAALGKTLSVTQFPDGHYDVAAGATAPATPAPRAPSSPSLPLTTFIDTNAENIHAADVYMELAAAGAMDEEEERMEALAHIAGKALANRFAFALDLDNYGPNEPHWCITPICYWEQEGCLSDEWLPGMQYILPRGASESCESVYEMMSPHGILPQAQKFFEAGFVWRRDMQDFIDPSVFKFIQAVEAAQKAKNGGDIPPPAAPQP